MSNIRNFVRSSNRLCVYDMLKAGTRMERIKRICVTSKAPKDANKITNLIKLSLLSLYSDEDNLSKHYEFVPHCCSDTELRHDPTFNNADLVVFAVPHDGRLVICQPDVEFDYKYAIKQAHKFLARNAFSTLLIWLGYEFLGSKVMIIGFNVKNTSSTTDLYWADEQLFHAQPALQYYVNDRRFVTIDEEFNAEQISAIHHFLQELVIGPISKSTLPPPITSSLLLPESSVATSNKVSYVAHNNKASLFNNLFRALCFQKRK